MLRKALAGTDKRRKTKCFTSKRLMFEKLEERRVLSASTLAYLAQDGTPFLPDIDDFAAGYDTAIAAVIGTNATAPELFITTTDNPANHVTASGVGFDGVAELAILLDSGGVAGCTGTLLPDGQSILTAAHCFTTGGLAVAANVSFDLPGGPQVIPVATITLHPTWNGDFFGTADIAVIGLATPAPAAADRYDIFRATNEVGSNIVKAGYGLSGTGLTGSTLATGTKRDGQNTVDALGDALDGVIYAPGTVLPGGHLLFDFDNGIAANDASGFFLGINDLGLGNSEVSTAQGDSGGPGFIDGRIAGVTSFGQGFNGLTDILPGPNSSFGEFAFDTRVSTYASWIDGIVDEAGAPTILDVTLSGTSWATGVEYAFSDLVAAGDQLRPIATQNVNTIEIQFSENVLLDGSELELLRTARLGDGSSQNSTVASANFSYDVGTHIATWTFGNLGDGKYSLELSTDVTDVAGNALDGEWSAMDAGTIDAFYDDPGSLFSVGNGVAGSLDYDLDGDEEFRLHFALLAGDYNGSGQVDFGDLLLWQNGDPASDGDGDGITGSSDVDDNTVWQIALGNLLPFRSDGGDFFDDEWVNATDLGAWSQGFGPNFDGAGFLTWQRTFGSKSVWFVESSSLLTAASSATVGLPPQVLNVIVSGSNSLHAPFSLDTVDGSGSQLATVPVGGADTISIVFSEGVNVDANSLTVIGLTTATLPQVADFSYDTATHTATWQFEGWAFGDQYVLSLSDAITDSEGNNLDGEWTNPASITTVNSSVSTFPSGDGLSGGRFNFVITLLPGDANLDGIVDSSDLGLLLSNWSPIALDQLFANGDFSGDGAVGASDFGAVLMNWGTNLQDTWVLADFDGDFDIDNSDLALISANLGLTGASWADGDLNGDGQVTLDDLDLAFAQFGLGLNMAA